MVKLEKKEIKVKKPNFFTLVAEDMVKHKAIYIMVIPVLVYYIVFHYGPLFGITIAFKDFRPGRGLLGSEWVGLKHFIDFLSSYYFWRLVKNTILISVLSILFGFPAPIILALLLNEVRSEKFKKTVQTITYMPHFISTVVVCGIITEIVATDGLVNDIIALFGGQRQNLLTVASLFRPIYIGSGIWQNIGWGTIIYLAALSGIDPNLYEAAKIDGANRLKQVIHVTLPGLAPTISILLIMRIGKIMSVGWQKIILLYTPVTYDTADVISTFVYRKGLVEANFSYSAAVGLFNSIINFALLIIANKTARKLKGTTLW